MRRLIEKTFDPVDRYVQCEGMQKPVMERYEDLVLKSEPQAITQNCQRNCEVT